ncbi:MAG TPA: RNA-binding domain-containing protein [Candidatus Acidoferrum sp.]|nr:RNA-binding domain-containing protein [Candidatus Acidoferrum sp.]
MAEVSVHIETEINQTESEEKLMTALTNILSNASITIKTEGKTKILNADAKGQESLSKLRTLMRNDRVRDASRKALFRSTTGNTISFCLNKQVAFAGHVSFCEETAESPLGPLKITIETDYPQQLIEWLAEKSS